MPRRQLTQLFPALRPLRQWQRKKLYYIKMTLDRNQYATTKAALFPYEMTSAQSLLINERTGADIQYQYNKAHNLRLASASISRTVIKPGETFSLWYLARHANERERYKDGLCVINGELTHVYGGGLCQLSNTLFWLFLHTPLTIVERHRHGVKEFPNPSPDDPIGVDATILEGWLDLRVRNDTSETYQVELSQTATHYRGAIRVETPPIYTYSIINENLNYFRSTGKTYEAVDVKRRKMVASTGEVVSEDMLYSNVTEIGYDI